MSNYELLLFCEKHNFDVEIKEKKSSMYGCCNTYGNEKYLVKCYFNLQEKFECWQKDFDLICWLRIKNDFGKRVLIEVQRQLGGVNYD